MRACSRCGSGEAIYPKARPCWCRDCSRAYNRDYMRLKRKTVQRRCLICQVPVPPRHAYCGPEHRADGHRRNKREWARRTRAEAKSSNRRWEQLQLPLEPILRLAAERGYSINAMGKDRARLIHRYQARGTVPAWFADEVVVGLLGAPDVFDAICAEASA